MPPKRVKKMRGGGDGYIPGVEINGISNFSPLDIPGLIIWVKADPAKLVSFSVDEYAQNQSPSIANRIVQQYVSNPSEQVITEIKSDVPGENNSLVRLELDSEPATEFPKFVTQPGTLDVITLKNHKLTTKIPVSVSPDFSKWIISKNVKIEFIDMIDKIVLSIENAEQPADFSEVIVFANKLNDTQSQQMEGYVAYRKNEQYVLDVRNPYLPAIESLPFLEAIAKQIQDTEVSLEQELELFDSSVSEYKGILPNDPILNSAPALRQRAVTALSQISDLRKNIIKGGLLSRKKGTETIDSVFESLNDLEIYTPPLTSADFSKKLADYSRVLQELQAYVKSLGNPDEAAAKAKVVASVKDQETQMLTAQTNEEVQFTQLQNQMRTIYQGLRTRSNAMNVDGLNQKTLLIQDFVKQVKALADAFDYYSKDVETRSLSLSTSFSEIDAEMSTGKWLTHIPSLDTSVVSTKERAGVTVSIQYTNAYVNKIQSLYEQIRNQVVEGDFAFVKGEILYSAVAMAKFYERLQGKKVPYTSKKTFVNYFRNKYRRLESYINEFDTTYAVISNATTALSNILKWNRQSDKPAPLDKSFPIPVTNTYVNSISKYYIREVNKYDNSFTGIEYVMTNRDGTLLYTENEEREIQPVYPSLENFHRHEQDTFFKKDTPFVDSDGNRVYQIYEILEPYKKVASIFDAIPAAQVIQRSFHSVEGLYEIPRDAVNTICEITLEKPQPAILLPKYALAAGSIFICVNKGQISLQIQVPGFPEDMVDTLGPLEVCVYNYLGSSTVNKSLYGRYWWDTGRIAYDTIHDTPRSSLCSKVTELSKYIFMRTATDPLFDKDGFLIEVTPDNSGNIYDIDDVYFTNPYAVEIGKEAHLSELTIHSEWDEKMVTSDRFDKLQVIKELSTNLPVFCNSSGVPAANEFGFCKYLMTPMYHIRDSIRTRGASVEPVNIQLNPAVTIDQFCMIPAILTFDSLFRTNFIRPFIINEVTFYVFINSAGDPIVSPEATYIQAENGFFEEPYSVSYTDEVTKKQAYIPKNLNNVLTNTNNLPVSPYKNVDVAAKRINFANKKTGDLLIYRYKINRQYTQSTLATVETKYNYCRTLSFTEIRTTLALLQRSYTEIEGYMDDFKKYETTVSDIESKLFFSSKSNQLKIAMDTLEMKMKKIVENVFISFTRASNAIMFFTKVVDKLESLKKSVKYLRDTVFIKNEESVIAIQELIRAEKRASGSTSSVDLSNLLNTMVRLKMDFDQQLATLEKNITTMPNSLVDLEDWVNKQQILIKKENDLRRQIQQLETANIVDIYTKREQNNTSSNLQQIQEIRKKADEFLAYKKNIALWLGIYLDQDEMILYIQESPKVATNKQFKGYSISFPVFEELSNPSFIRDWLSLPKIMQLSDSLRSSIFANLIEPVKAFIIAHSAFYTGSTDTHDIPTVDSLGEKALPELQEILSTAKTTMDELTANAITMETVLHPVFDSYIKIRSDLRTEFQTILQEQAATIMSIWTDITGKRAAIQTNLQILQPYASPEQITQSNMILGEIDQALTTEVIQKAQTVQQTTKIPGFYSTITYIDMIRLYNERVNIHSMLIALEDTFIPIQANFDSLQANVLIQLKGDTANARAKLTINIQNALANFSTAFTASPSLKTLQETIQPKANALISRQLDTISDCMEVNAGIAALNTQIKALV